MQRQPYVHHDYLKRWRSPPQASLAEVALVRVQDPIQLSQYSEPEPDIAVVQIDARKYIAHHHTPNEIFLLIEVADTTLGSFPYLYFSRLI